MTESLKIPNPQRHPPKYAAWPAILAIIAAFIGAILFLHGRVPLGLNNDVAEEALRGIYLVKGGHLEVITFSIGNSAETLYLYLLGIVTSVFGATISSIQIASGIAAVAVILALWKLGERLRPAPPTWLLPLLSLCSIWLLHYTLSGLRAIAAPLFFALFAISLDYAEEPQSSIRSSLMCGAVLGLSVYAYSADRVLPIAFLIYAIVRLLAKPELRQRALRRYATIAASAFAASIPNIVFAALHPREFFYRGSYVFLGNASDRALNMLGTIFLPFFYPEFYRHIYGQAFHFDGVSAGLTVSGQNPIHIVYAAAIALGVWQMKHRLKEPLVLFTLLTWILTVLSIGTAGPSLTRMLILLPVYLILAALGFSWMANAQPRLRVPIFAVIVLVGVSDGYKYLSSAGKTPEYLLCCFNPAATAIGNSAAELAAQGRRVVAVLSRDANVVNFLTSEYPDRTKTIEFSGRAIDPKQIPLDHGSVLLFENNPTFNVFTAQLPRELLKVPNEFSYAVDVP